MSDCNKHSGSPGLVVVPEDGLWDAEQVAAFLNMSKSWVWKQVREKKGLPFMTFGGRNYRFDPARVRAWMLAQAKAGEG